MLPALTSEIKFLTRKNGGVLEVCWEKGIHDDYVFLDRGVMSFDVTYCETP